MEEKEDLPSVSAYAAPYDALEHIGPVMMVRFSLDVRHHHVVLPGHEQSWLAYCCCCCCWGTGIAVTAIKEAASADTKRPE